MSTLLFRNASACDASTVINIVNRAYRTEGGWTTESHLVVGDRLVEADYLLSLDKENQLILLAEKKNEIVGCIEIQATGTLVHLGMLAVLPENQNQGIASELLRQAEKIAKGSFMATQICMFVLDVRKELLDFYFRKGYQRTHEYAPFPVELNVGKPISENLIFEKIIKTLV